MLLSYKWMDGWVGLGSLCGAIVRASLRDANKISVSPMSDMVTATATPSSYISHTFITRMGVDPSKWGWTKLQVYLQIFHFLLFNKDAGGPIQMGVDQIDRYACRYAVYLGSFLFPFVSEKIFHCKPNLAQSLNLYSTHCVDNLSCPQFMLL